MYRSGHSSSRLSRHEREEGEVEDTPSRAGPSRPTLPRKPGAPPAAAWSNPFDEMGRSQAESSNVKPKDTWSPEKAGALPLPEKPIAALGSRRGKSPEYREAPNKSEMGWMPGDSHRRRSGEGIDRYKREEERGEDRYGDRTYQGDSRRDHRGAQEYRPRYDDWDRSPPRALRRNEDRGYSRRGSPPIPRKSPGPRGSSYRRSPSPLRGSRYDGPRDSDRGNGSDRYGTGSRDADRDRRDFDRYADDDKRDRDHRYRQSDRYYDERDDRPRAHEGHSDRNGHYYDAPRNGSNGRHTSSGPLKNGRSPRRRSPSPPTPPTRPEPEEGEVSSPELPPARPRSPPPEEDMFGPPSERSTYKPKILKRSTGSHPKLDTLTHDSPRSSQPGGPGPPPPPVNQPPTPPPPIDAPPPPAVTPPPTPPVPDRGPNPYLVNHNKSATKVRPEVDLSNAPTGPKIGPSGQAPNRDPTQSMAKSVTPAPAKPPKKQEKFTMWTEGQEKEKLGRIFHGTTTLNDYDLGTKLGEGTFGVVTKGVEKGSGAVVALKKLITHNPRDGVSVTTTREIRILKALHHENVVPIRAMVVHRKCPTDKTERGEVFMVFPYMDHDLCGLLANTAFNATFTLAKLLLKQLLEGLAYIHAQNIIHRDIKTANILVDRAGRIMIADFGLARSWTPRGTMPPHDENEYTNMVVTRWYRAPELLLGSTKYGPEIDLWSAGCVFGEMFSRTPILCGESDRDQLYKIITRCGPLDEHYPAWAELPGFPDAPGHPWDQTPLEKSIVEQSTEWGMDRCSAELLGQMLRLDPAKRVTAAEALEHTWFWVSPLPAKPKDGLITVESSHEFTTRKPEKPAPAPAPRHQPAYNRQVPPQNYQSRSHMPHHRSLGPHQQPGMGNMPYGGGVQQGMAYSQGGQPMPNQNPYQPMPPQQAYHQQPGYPAHHTQQPYLPAQNGFQPPSMNPYNQVPLAPSGYPQGMPPPIPTQHQSRSGINAPAPPFILAGGGGRANTAPGLPTKPGMVPPPPMTFKLQSGGGGSVQPAAGLKRPPAGPAAEGSRDKRYRPDNGGLDYGS